MWSYIILGSMVVSCAVVIIATIRKCKPETHEYKSSAIHSAVEHEEKVRRL